MTSDDAPAAPDAKASAFMRAAGLQFDEVGPTAVTGWIELGPVRSMVSGRVDVRADAIQQGRTAQLWEVRVTDADDRLVALGQVRLQNVTPRT
jgi:uncharacterized protein (TIGR00369 family)